MKKEIKIDSIETIIKKQINHTDRNSHIAGIAAFAAGLFTHLFILTNEFANHDDIAMLWEQYSGVQTYRWFQSICSPLISVWGPGLIAGIITLIILSISAILLVDTLKLKSAALSAVVGALMSCCTIVGCFMSYPNGSFLFAVGIPFAILSLRWYDRGIGGFIAASVAMMFAISGYQSNICITIACLFVQLYCELLSKEFNIKKWWIRFGKAFAMLICGVILFVLSTKVTGAINNTQGLSIGVTTSELTVHGYEGQKESGNVYITEIVESVKYSFNYFIRYHFNILYDGANISVANLLICISNFAATVLCGVAVLISFIKQKGIIRRIMIVLVSLVAPICINSTEIILNGKCHETLQMMYSMVITFVLFACVIEKSEMVHEKLRTLMTNIMFMALVIILYGNIQINNDAYQRMNSAYETAYSEMTRIMYRVELLPEWQEGCRTIYFDFGDEYGYLINDNYQAMRVADDRIDMGWMGVFGTGIYEFWHDENAAKFVKCYLGVDFESPEKEQIQRIKESEEYQNLDKYPSTDSIMVIDDVIVIRMDN